MDKQQSAQARQERKDARLIARNRASPEARLADEIVRIARGHGGHHSTQRNNEARQRIIEAKRARLMRMVADAEADRKIGYRA